MNNQRDEILQQLIARYPYIQYAALFSDQAELLNQPVGHWAEENEENIESVVGKILYVLQEISSTLSKEDVEPEEVEQIWLKLEQGHLIVLRCSSDTFLVIKTNNQVFLGELRKVVEGTAKKIENLSDDEDELPVNPQRQLEKNVSPSGKLRGRDFIE